MVILVLILHKLGSHYKNSVHVITIGQLTHIVGILPISSPLQKKQRQ